MIGAANAGKRRDDSRKHRHICPAPNAVQPWFWNR